MGVPLPVKHYTPEEYYRLEREAAYKSDYYNGEIFAMAGGSSRHALIGSNINREIGNQLKGTPCVTYSADLRIKINATGLRVYPDGSVFCDPWSMTSRTPNPKPRPIPP